MTPPRPQRFAHFGWSMAARGDLVAIGAPYEDEPSCSTWAPSTCARCG
ncbi:hypothetical protein [Nonomuraea rubra]